MHTFGAPVGVSSSTTVYMGFIQNKLQCVVSRCKQNEDKETSFYFQTWRLNDKNPESCLQWPAAVGQQLAVLRPLISRARLYTVNCVHLLPETLETLTVGGCLLLCLSLYLGMPAVPWNQFSVCLSEGNEGPNTNCAYMHWSNLLNLGSSRIVKCDFTCKIFTQKKASGNARAH